MGVIKLVLIYTLASLGSLAGLTSLCIYTREKFNFSKVGLVPEQETQLTIETVSGDRDSVVIDTVLSLQQSQPDLLVRRTNFRITYLRKLREMCHIDDYKNTNLNRKVLKRKLVTLIRTDNPDIRTCDLFHNADTIVELFFIPTYQDITNRNIRYSSYAIQRVEEYNRPIWIGSWTRFFLGRPLLAYPENETQ